MDLLDNQPEFTKSVWDYLDLLVNDDAHREGPRAPRQVPRHLRRGRARLRRRPLYHRGDLGRGDQLRRAGRRPSGDPLDRDARLHRPPADLFPRANSSPRWTSFRRGDVRPDRLVGSWAGAFGPTQFMPTAFKRFAVDFDGDGRRDVVDSRAGPHRLDRQQPEEGRLGRRPDLGLRSGGAGEFQFHARRQASQHDDRASGSGLA